MTDDEKPKKRKWVQGIDYSHFSGRSWKELHDIWPVKRRLNSEAWRILGLLPAALEASKRFQKTLLSEPITFRDLMMLAWVQRCEEAKEGVATPSFLLCHGLELSRRLLGLQKGKITRLGLIEKMVMIADAPAQPLRLYRVTEMGKIVLRNLVENLERAHENIHQFYAREPESTKETINKYLSYYCFEWETLNFGEPGPPPSKKEK